MSNILRIKNVTELTNLSKGTIYRLANNNHFPKPIKLGLRSSGWVAKEVNDWLNNRIAERDNKRVAKNEKGGEK